MYQQAVDNADVKLTWMWRSVVGLLLLEVDLDLAVCGWPLTSCCVSVMKPAKGGWLD